MAPSWHFPITGVWGRSWKIIRPKEVVIKGEKGVIDYLNRALRSELTAINQYVLHAHLLEDWGLENYLQSQYKAE